MIGCPNRYKPPSKHLPNICLANSCPILSDMQLEECIASCNERNECHLFNHVNIGKYSRCFLYGYDEEKGERTDSPCGIKLGNTCCEKGE